jgi:hypothetical protein
LVERGVEEGGEDGEGERDEEVAKPVYLFAGLGILVGWYVFPGLACRLYPVLLLSFSFYAPSDLDGFPILVFPQCDTAADVPIR